MNLNTQELPEGQFGIVIALGEGKAAQISLNEEQSILFKAFLAIMSKENPLIKLPSEYDLVLNSSKYIVCSGE